MNLRLWKILILTTKRLARPAAAFWVVLAVLAPGRSAAGQSRNESEQWSVIMIAGTPVGYVFESWKSGSGRDFVLVSESKIVLNRLGNRVELETRSRTEETAGGRLLRVDSELRASVMSTKSTAVVRDGKIEITSEAGGKSYSRSVSYTGELLGPEGIRLLTQAKLRRPGDEIEFQTFAAETGTVTKGRRKALTRENILIGGRSFSTLKVQETIEAAGMDGLAWLDERGESIKGEIPTPFGNSEIIRTDRRTALAAAGGGELPDEMYARSILKTNIRLPGPRSLEMLRVKLSFRDPGGDWPELDRPGQAVVSKTASDLVLEIRRPSVPPPATRPVAETEANLEFLRPNESIQSDLPEIRKKAQEIVGAEKDVFQAALKLERWVSENMTFDLGIAFAPASELIRNKRGTCLGYATFLATLARAVGIPSRVVLGYVYVLGMFGGHAWTEVLVGSAWIPVDAAVVSAGVADPARIAFSASSLAEGPLSLTGGAAARLFGGTDVKVLAYGREGRIVQVPEGQPVFRVDGDSYSNPGLGITWKKPSGFAFTETGAVWPDPTVVAVEGPGGSRTILQEMAVLPWKDVAEASKELLGGSEFKTPAVPFSFGKLSGWKAESSKKAALVLLNGPEVWLLTAEGKNAPDLLDQAVRGLRFGGEAGDSFNKGPSAVGSMINSH